MSTGQAQAGQRYRRFIVMVLVSTLLMFGLMYLNTYAASHLFFSQTRMWMALLMGAAMALLMLAFMHGMYSNGRANLLIVVVCLLTFGVALWLVRSQRTVDDVAYMKAMIPHHSIAILTSRRARIVDPRVRELADGIIATQEREIARMEALIADLEDQRQTATQAAEKR
ncbi:DUF305 domain-containing protein [Pseudoxanthomonas dokdonensis]|nr:DUF305 domain-containing protein [Pseudoxanthomonas dokdonensis]